MARIDGIKKKLAKYVKKEDLDGVLIYAEDQDPDVRYEVVVALSQLPSYDTGMSLIPFLRDPSPMIREVACSAVAEIMAKNCEEYVRKMAFEDPDARVRIAAKAAYDMMKDSVV